MVSDIKKSRILLYSLIMVAVLGFYIRLTVLLNWNLFPLRNLHHSHSHFAFTAWIGLGLFFMIYTTISNSLMNKKFTYLFYALFFCSIGMVISFAVQGYGPISIILSTVSLLLNYWIIGMIISKKRKVKPEGGYLLYSAFFFNVLSTLGTFYLAFLMASKNTDSQLMQLSVQFYLHFQFNGWFILGAVYLLQQCFSEIIKISLQQSLYLSFFTLLTFAQSLLPLYHNNIVIGISLFATIGQLALYFYILMPIFKINITRFQRSLLFMSLTFFCIKLILQILSSLPVFFDMYFLNHPLTIAYLHLIFLLVLSNQLLFFFINRKILREGKKLKAGIVLFNAGIILTELQLVFQGVNLSFEIATINLMLASYSLIILVGTLVIALSIRNDTIKADLPPTILHTK